MRNKTKTHLKPHHNPLSKSNLLITGQIQVDIRQLQAKRFLENTYLLGKLLFLYIS